MRRAALFAVLVLTAGCGKKSEPVTEPAPNLPPSGTPVAHDSASPAPPPVAVDLSLVPAGVTVLPVSEPNPPGDPVIAGKPVSAWRTDLSDPNETIAKTAVRVLLASGAPARAAMPELLAAANRLGWGGFHTVVDGVIENAFKVRFGAAALPQLVAALKSPDSKVRDGAATVIGSFGPAASRAVPALAAAAVAATNFNEFSTVLVTLERIGPVSKAAIPTLTPRLKDEAPVFRWATARLFAVLGVTTDEVYAALIEPFDNPDGLFHAAASVLPLLLYGEKGLTFVTLPKNWEKPLLSLEFSRALPNLGDRAGPIVAHYQKRLVGPNAEEIGTACRRLSEIGRPAAAAAPQLAELVRTGPPECRTAAATALSRVTTDAPTAIAAIQTLLPTTDQAIFAIGRLGAVAKSDAIAALKPLLTVPDADAAQRAARELVRFAPEIEGLYPALVRGARYGVPLPNVTRQSLPGLRVVLAGEDKLDREVAAQVIVRLEPADAAARAIVLASDWVDYDTFGSPPAKRVRAGVVAAVAALGADAVPPLERLLGHVDPNVRASAAHALGRLGPVARGTVPALQKALGSTSIAEQLAAAEALVRIDPADRAALPVLIELAKPANREKLAAAKLPGSDARPADRLATAMWAFDPETAAKSGALAAGDVIR